MSSLFRAAALSTENISFYKMNNLNEEINCTEPSPSVRVPCLHSFLKVRLNILTLLNNKLERLKVQDLFGLWSTSSANSGSIFTRSKVECLLRGSINSLA